MKRIFIILILLTSCRSAPAPKPAFKLSPEAEEMAKVVFLRYKLHQAEIEYNLTEKRQ